ncbi:high affinity copper uptake protein 1 [Elysia marginata]|uniref:Copper transport protein n=1 Tax=Elysia marginata TaxID=1093978 RepID=A0AAV4IC42_9GAST|nr:high affinity copper uptake protein 1 [Elysia marginata]
MKTFNFFWGYILMLLVMTYNIWFLVAVLIGSGVGYFLFDPLRQMYAQKYLDDPQPGAAVGQQSPQPTPEQRAAINSQALVREIRSNKPASPRESSSGESLTALRLSSQRDFQPVSDNQSAVRRLLRFGCHLGQFFCRSLTIEVQ